MKEVAINHVSQEERERRNVLKGKCNKSIKLGTYLEHDPGNIFSYTAIADLTFDLNGNCFLKWPPFTCTHTFLLLDTRYLYLNELGNITSMVPYLSYPSNLWCSLIGKQVASWLDKVLASSLKASH